MPLLRNPKHERFAQELAKGKSGAAAYRLAGYKGDRRDATKLRHSPDVARRLEEILASRDRAETKAVERTIERTAIGRATSEIRGSHARPITVRPRKTVEVAKSK